ncbi:MAG: class I SAM-dependent methyltransferase [Zoogloea sp.]|uniref:class I SAM-dependent methyltransferase n=1 Tax=Zoogloea sp. TaxID=49181 RepID=UPI003F30B601|nr:class I SAM-dependent methyltransferase [Rhodocyclales bacterium]
MSESFYQFTNNWFEGAAKSVWDALIPQINPKRVLEIGSYEGASACYLIDKISEYQDLELHCIDTWEGGIEHQVGGSAQTDMSEVEQRFRHNTKIATERAGHIVDLFCYKGYSDIELSKMLAKGMQGYFDFIYVDGSHQAPDVLLDAVLSFKLLRVDGVLAFDDYLWQEPLPYGTDPVRCPKIAIDAFSNIYCRKTRIISAPLYQLYVQKISE